MEKCFVLFLTLLFLINNFLLLLMLQNSNEYIGLQRNLTSINWAATGINISNSSKDSELKKQDLFKRQTQDSQTELLDSCVSTHGVFGFMQSFYKFYLHESERQGADSVRNICKQTKGYVAKFDNEDVRATFRKVLLRQFERTDTKLLDTTVIKILKHPQFDFYKFRSRGVNGSDPTDVTSWKTPEKGMLAEFRLFKMDSQESTFNEKISFCWRKDSDTIEKECEVGSNLNFEAYGILTEQAEAETYLVVYNYVNPVAGASYLSLSSEIPGNNFVRSSYPQFAIPQVGIFIGARSDINESAWILSDGSVINDPLYPTANPSYCQQLTWQFGYDDGLNFQSKNCSDEIEYKAKFICEYAVEYDLTPALCDGTLLNFTWSSGVLLIIDDTYFMNIEVFPSRFYTAVPFRKSYFVIDDLIPRTEYTVRASVSSAKGCFKEPITSVLSVKTSYGKPQAVKNPKLIRNEDQTSETCILEWSHDYFLDVETKFYRIILTNNFEIEYQYDFETPENPTREQRKDRLIRYEAEIPDNMKGSSITFTIQGFSCEGPGEMAEVPEKCNVLRETKVVPPLKRFSVIGLFSTIAGIFAAIIIVVSVRNRRTKKQHDAIQRNSKKLSVKSSKQEDPLLQDSKEITAKLENANGETFVERDEEYFEAPNETPYNQTNEINNLDAKTISLSDKQNVTNKNPEYDKPEETISEDYFGDYYNYLLNN